MHACPALDIPATLSVDASVAIQQRSFSYHIRAGRNSSRLSITHPKHPFFIVVCFRPSLYHISASTRDIRPGQVHRLQGAGGRLCRRLGAPSRTRGLLSGFVRNRTASRAPRRSRPYLRRSRGRHLRPRTKFPAISILSKERRREEHVRHSTFTAHAPLPQKSNYAKEEINAVLFLQALIAFGSINTASRLPLSTPTANPSHFLFFSRHLIPTPQGRLGDESLSDNCRDTPHTWAASDAGKSRLRGCGRFKRRFERFIVFI